MKKAAMMLLVLSCAVGTAYSQTAHVFGSVGYGFGYGGYTGDIFQSYTDDRGELSDVEDHYFNYGRGIKLDVGGWYALMEDLGVQAALGFSFGVPDINTEQNTTALVDTRTDNTEYDFFVFSIKVQAVPRFTVVQLLDMYLGVGTGLYFASLSSQTEAEIGGTTYTESETFDSKAALGFNGFMGADFPLMEDLSLFGEIGFEQLSFTWKKQEITETNIPGSSESTVTFDKDRPDLPAPPKIPGSNWSLRVGVKYWLF
ncbi:MAG: hypothetical protein ACOC4C_05340 [Fibrobacterota bacterium]